ncbi:MULTISPECIES: BolA family protein [Chromohalobacter]|jgi:acid stress-induced BolA-like protein IbaG/YrbA|uniref:BolA-like protein n=1 Tax=Chromohalobacter israelensis (strain ATCC BAA-138 / DSM 3043 / CIP 106854 / NCIMB 13768 / 1H11) TaxID=290398 RepID=Q1QVE2_CHRI1|nr:MULTISPECIES: BolA family protein [Chromohalobacter]ABE59566.1 BolA-like protein [Chromohalobacter salexigens DSM 3043]MBZ5874664.1 BolA family transcriptional regulator [Chromohalobacter salexigens]MDF9433469.1 BolA family transcriptional regulator [Chromohalobacter israelensis]MDO0946289.1 BolA family protein [Chromohalobacter salexigens]NQY46085.1 BolA family transcriptional regulator [Chromohalobacter sp.]
MQPSDVKALLESRIDDCQFHIQGEGCNFQVVAISEAFAGLSPVKRQQLIYSALSDEIASGALHAISIKTYTPDQWETAPENVGV